MVTRDRSLDGVRGIAALWVVAAHASYQSLLPPVVNLKGAGRGGVVIFFFLSAYLISGPLLTRPRTSLHWRQWLAYWIRRLCRIVPLYYLVLFAAFYFHLNPFNRQPASSVLLTHLSFQEGWSIFWTIVVEMKFYFVLPFLLIPMAWVLETTKRGRLLLSLAMLTWLAGVSFGVIQHGFMRTLGIDKHAPIFVAGVLTALVLTAPHFHRETSKLRIAKECLAWLSMFAILVLSIPAIYFWITQGVAISAYVATSPEYEAFWDARIPWIGLIFGVFFLSLSDEKIILARVLASPPLAWTGKVSFGIYLLHLDVFEAFDKFPRHGATRLLIALAICIALAYVLHRTVEAPAIDLGKRLSEKIVKR